MSRTVYIQLSIFRFGKGVYTYTSQSLATTDNWTENHHAKGRSLTSCYLGISISLYKIGRLNLPGGLFHIIGRGIERRHIFSTASDKQDFLDRLSTVLSLSDHCCYAWALMDNHYHLLLRQGRESLSKLMGPLLGAYAQSYNRRNGRVGYLYQGRYRSILCEEDTYFLELVR